MTMVHDLISEPLLSFRDTARQRGMTTLPGLLAKLASGELGDFPAVRAHQLHPWSMFLTQLAAIALHKAGKKAPGVSEAGWRSMLLALTDDAHEPWCLVVDDPSRPAFLQAPVPRGASEVAKWKVHDLPDDLDILVTSKAHDVKRELMGAPAAESWVYAMVALQTTQGFLGAGMYGVSRMNGGFGSRPRIGLAPDHSLSGRFRRDLTVMRDGWPAQLARGFRDDGISLTWTVPWDGAKSLALADLAPHFIESCRRLRLRRRDDGFCCAHAGSKQIRSLAGSGTGDVGDPWIPIQRKGGTALTVGGSGFDYRRLSELLEDAYEPGDALVVRKDDGPLVLLLAAALVRGQGKTEGLHDRALVLEGEIRRRFGQADGRATLGRRAKLQVERAHEMRSKVLFSALKAIALGEKPVADSMHERIDEAFFPSLFATLAEDDSAAQLAWERRLAALARVELQRAIERCCIPDARRYRAIASAESLFAFQLRKCFPDVVAAESRQAAPSIEGAQP